ncbi:MAG TPA: nucleotidyltransferase family protein [Rhodospirillales bacterium]|nr:nucleotidyltransferase family protein [Rhodospirillales bacterium]
MTGVTAILLAAGLSQRFGAANKLLLEIDGQAMARRVAAAICASQAARVVVVLGHQADQVATVLAGLNLETVINPLYSDGQVSSVRAGVAAVNDDATGFMMCLADQPQLQAGDYDALIDAFNTQPDRVVVPYVGKKRGNPVVLPIALRDRILAGGVNEGCRSFIDSHPQLVRQFHVTNDGYRDDFDTAEHFSTLVSK